MDTTLAQICSVCDIAYENENTLTLSTVMNTGGNNVKSTISVRGSKNINTEIEAKSNEFVQMKMMQESTAQMSNSVQNLESRMQQQHINISQINTPCLNMEYWL